MAATDEVRELVLAFYESFNQGDASAWDHSLADDVVGIGSDPDEWWEGPTVVVKVGTSQVRQMHAAGISIATAGPKVFAEGDVAWAVDQPTVTLKDGTSVPMRFTLIASRAGGKLQIRHFHLSAGATNEDVLGEELPTS